MPDKYIPLEERIILALDVDSPQVAQEWVLRTESRIRFFKVGLQLFLSGGFAMVDWLVSRGHKVMLDLKFFDIPETVSLAVAQLNNRGVALATVHGNDAILRAAIAARGDVRILAVTVLTSFDESDLRDMGMTGTVEDLVLLRARRALELGCDGVVSSGLEAARLREHLGSKLLLVTPGIRPGANIEDRCDDQKRIITARMALENGADHVVVGRPITRAIDPIAVIDQLQQEISDFSE